MGSCEQWLEGGGVVLMVTKYVYTMKIEPRKFLDLIEGAIGRRPDECGKSGLHTWSFTFLDADVSPAERQLALDALPDWLRLLYSFDREVVVEE